MCHDLNDAYLCSANESFYLCSRFTCALANESTGRAQITWRIWMSHVTQISESCHTYEWVMSHKSVSHVVHISRQSTSNVTHWPIDSLASHVYYCATCLIHIKAEHKYNDTQAFLKPVSHVTHMNESYPTYESVTSHIWMSVVAHMNESCHTVAHLPRSYVTHSRFHMWHTGGPAVQRHSVFEINESCHTYEWVMSHIRMSHVTQHYTRHIHMWHTFEWVVSHMNESCHTAAHMTHWHVTHRRRKSTKTDRRI